MAITLRTAGTWADNNATTMTVTLPTHQEGDMIIIRAACKAATVANVNAVINTTGWTKIGQGNNGTTASGNGTGSVVVAAFYKIATSSSETSPVIEWGTTAAPGIAVPMVYQKGTGEIWLDPVGDDGPDTTSNTSHSATIATHIKVYTGDLVDFFSAQADDTTQTVPTITQTGVTFDAVTESPAAAFITTLSNDMAGDGGYRTATSGVSTAAAVVTGTLSTSETGTSWMTRLRVITAPTGQAQAKIVGIGRGFGQAAGLITRNGETSVTDTFTRSVTDGLGTADTGGTWTFITGTATTGDVNGSEATFQITSPGGYVSNLKDVLIPQSASIRYKVKISSFVTTTNLDFIWISSNLRSGVSDPSQASQAGGYGAEIFYDDASDALQLRVKSGGSGTVLGSVTAPVANTWYVVETTFVPTSGAKTRLRGKIYADGSTPSSYTEDSNTAITESLGHVGIRVPANSGYQPLVSIDDLEIKGAGWTVSGQAQAQIFREPIKSHGQANALINASISGTGNTVWADTFTRSIGTGFGTADTGGPYTHSSTTSLSVDGTRGVISTTNSRLITVDSVSVQDVDVLALFEMPSSLAAGVFGIVLRHIDTNTFYRVGLDPQTGTSSLEIHRYVGGVGTSIDNGISGPTVSGGSLVWVRVQAQGINPTTLRVKAWLDGGSEPGTWGDTVTDSNAAHQAAGAVGFRFNIGTQPGYVHEVTGTNLLIPSTYTQVIDTFTRSVTDGWGTADDGGDYTFISGSAPDFDVNGSTGTMVHTISNHISLNKSLIDITKGFAFSVDFTISAIPATGSTVLSRWAILGSHNSNDTSLWGLDIRLGVNSGTGLVVLRVVYNGTTTINTTGSALTAGDMWRAVVISRIFPNGSVQNEGYIYKIGTEPGAPATTTVTIPTPVLPGHLILRASNSLDSGSTWSFDNLNFKPNASWFGRGQAQATIVIQGATRVYAQAQGSIKQTYVQHGQAQADIKQVYNVHAQAQAGIKQTYFGLGQAQGSIKQTYFGLGQAQADIKAEGRGLGQSQADIKQTYVQHGQAQADIKQTYFGLGQTQAAIKAVGRGLGQAQANIKATSNAFGQAQADVKQTYNVHGQTQALIARTSVSHGQAQASVKQTYVQHGQTQAWIKATYAGLGQTQANIKATSNAFGQAQGYLQPRAFGQAQADIKQTYFAHGQAQGQIKQSYVQHGQTQGQIKTTYNVHGQAQALIKTTYVVHGQAQTWIKNTYFGLGQAQAQIKQVYVQHGQSQAWIENTYNGFGQAQGAIKTTYNQHGQAQAFLYVPQVSHPDADISVTGWVRVVI